MTVIHTPTLKDYIKVIEWAFDQDMEWHDGGRSICEFYWEEYGSELCIIIRNGVLTFCRREYVISNYETDILSMKQFHKKTRVDSINKFGKKYGLR